MGCNNPKCYCCVGPSTLHSTKSGERDSLNPVTPFASCIAPCDVRHAETRLRRRGRKRRITLRHMGCNRPSQLFAGPTTSRQPQRCHLATVTAQYYFEGYSNPSQLVQHSVHPQGQKLQWFQPLNSASQRKLHGPSSTKLRSVISRLVQFSWAFRTQTLSLLFSVLLIELGGCKEQIGLPSFRGLEIESSARQPVSIPFNFGYVCIGG